MEELDFIKNERLKLQEEYLKQSKNIWTNFEGVEASFVIGKLEDECIGVSARSLGEIDVSEPMKKMGGGGHSSNAATQIKDKTLKEVKQEIVAKDDAINDIKNTHFALYQINMVFNGKITESKKYLGQIVCGRDLQEFAERNKIKTI